MHFPTSHWVSRPQQAKFRRVQTYMGLRALVAFGQRLAVSVVLAHNISSGITKTQAMAVWDAAVFAFCINMPLNWSITIHLSKGCVDRSHDFVSRFLKLASEWIRRQTNGPACWCYVLENHGGLHVHILLYVPHRLIKEFKSRERGWAEIAGATLYPTVYFSEAVWDSTPGCETEAYLRNGLLGSLRYMLKGIDPNEGSALAIPHIDQGKVCGKRVGYSQALGPKPRLRSFAPRPANAIRTKHDSSHRRQLIRCYCPGLLGLKQRPDGGWG